ncbi:hypothetical protein [Edaphobacter modestus]|uniref:Uncharacterized protein n=1 Tax=Edaphobacter modestus TaxID=388466 RepID=A0A4Q7YTR3_9BACT|nr:hypothetical protein [Edaphobacter modestus]RZU40950.1 hypothetical protein BDD14_2441 [Edaphobacter modestus]
MTPPIGFRTSKSTDSNSTSMGIRPAVSSDPIVPGSGAPSRGADYAYRIAALTAGLVLLATVM